MIIRRTSEKELLRLYGIVRLLFSWQVSWFLHRYRILYCFSSFLQDDDTGCRQDAAACRTQEEARNQIIKNDDSTRTRSGGIIIQIGGHHRLHDCHHSFMFPTRRSFMTNLFVVVDRSLNNCYFHCSLAFGINNFHLDISIMVASTPLLSRGTLIKQGAEAVRNDSHFLQGLSHT